MMEMERDGEKRVEKEKARERRGGGREREWKGGGERIWRGEGDRMEGRGERGQRIGGRREWRGEWGENMEGGGREWWGLGAVGGGERIWRGERERMGGGIWRGEVEIIWKEQGGRWMGDKDRERESLEKRDRGREGECRF